MSDSRSTRIWQLLESVKSADALVTKMKPMMENIYKVLAKGETAASDFTLHDEDHGFRVAERMVDVITWPVLEKMSSTEWALLLLSAYLHDIGMTPEKAKVRGH